MRKPVICAVNGACLSGALEMALSCSCIVASERARFADTHAMLGVVPTWGLTALLPRAVGVRKAREMSITGEFVDAAEALRLGVVNHVVPHDELLRFTLRLAAKIPSTSAVSGLLGLYVRGEDLSLAGALAAETAHSAGRAYDLEAFTAAGTATAARLKGARDDGALLAGGGRWSRCQPRDRHGTDRCQSRDHRRRRSDSSRARRAALGRQALNLPRTHSRHFCIATTTNHFVP